MLQTQLSDLNALQEAAKLLLNWEPEKPHLLKRFATSWVQQIM